MDKDKAWQIFYSLKDYFRLDDPHHIVRKPRTCLECELIGAGFFFSVSAYLYYLTRLNRINVYGGKALALMLVCAGASVIFNPNPFEEKEKITPGKISQSIEENNRDTKS